MFYAIVALIAMILDQMLKYWTGTNIPLNAVDGPVIIPGLLRLTNLHNTGAAFSLLAGGKFTWFFVLLCVVFVGGVIYALRKDIIQTVPARWAAVIVMAGAVGNCADRVINTAVDAAGYSHYVVDMFELIPFNFPVFNLADVYITVGAILFCIFTLLEKGEAEFAREEVENKGYASGGGAHWDVVKEFAGRNAAATAGTRPRRTLSEPEDTDGDDLDGGASDWDGDDRPVAKQFREWKVMEAPDLPRETFPEAEDAEDGGGPAEGKTVYTRPARGPGGEAAFSRTEEAVRNVQAQAASRRPQPVEAPPAGAGGSAAPKGTNPERRPAASGKAGPLFSKTEQVVRTIVQGNPPPAAPPAQPQPSGTSSGTSGRGEPVENDSYDLDDILAEFRDL